MKTLILLIIIIISVLSSCDNSPIITSKNKVIMAAEQAYFEGQGDAIEGDVRIKKDSDSCWIWRKSCWDSGRPPLFNPNFNCN